MAASGYEGEVRSPTFNLLYLYDTEPPVAHADLYRLSHWRESGLEEYLDTHACFVEWAMRSEELNADPRAIRIKLSFEPGGGRAYSVDFPEPA